MLHKNIHCVNFCFRFQISERS